MRQINHTAETTLTKVVAIVMMITALMGASLPVLSLPGIGTLYLFRLLVPFLFVWMILSKMQFSRNMRHMLQMIIVWCVCGCISLIWSFDRTNSIQGVVNICFCVVWVLWLAGAVKTAYIFDRLMIVFVAFVTCCCALGIYEVFTGNYIFSVQPGVESVITSIGRHYPVTVFYNPNDFMVFVAASIPIVFYLTDKKCSRWLIKLIVDITYLLMSFVLMILADCRMGLLVVPFIVIMWIVSKKWEVRFYKVVIVGIIAIIMLMIVHPSIAGLVANESRWDIWRDALYNLRLSYFMGTGIGNANIHLPGHIYKSTLTATHFWFLQVLAEIGVVGFYFVAKWFITSVLRARRGVVSTVDKQVLGLRRISLTLLLAMIFLSMMSSGLTESPAFWTLIAIMQISGNLESNNSH